MPLDGVALPPEGDTAWYPHYSAMDETIREIAPTGGVRAVGAGEVADTVDAALQAGNVLSGGIGVLSARLATRGEIPTSLVFAGSSTTRGSQATRADARYVNLLVTLFQHSYPSSAGYESTTQSSLSADFSKRTEGGVHGYNVGEGGTNASNYLTPAEITLIGALEPAMVLHMIGANDYSQGVDPATYKVQVIAALDDINDASSLPCVHVLVQTYARWDVTSPAYPWESYGQALKEISEDRPDAIFIDLSPSYLAVGVPSLDPLNLINVDNVHQGDAGHEYMADLIWRALGLSRPTEGYVGDWLDSERGMIADFDAATLKAGSVSAWPPKRGTEHAAPQLLSGGTAPTLDVDATPSDLPAVVWPGGVLSALQTKDWDQHSLPMTLVYVFRFTDGAQPSNVNSGSGNGGYAYLSMDATGTELNAGFNANQMDGTPFSHALEWTIAVLTGDTTETAITVLTQSAPSPTRSVGAAATDLDVLGGITIASTSVGSAYSAVDIARLAVIDRVLPAPEIATLIADLQAKYGI